MKINFMLSRERALARYRVTFPPKKKPHLKASRESFVIDGHLERQLSYPRVRRKGHDATNRRGKGTEQTVQSEQKREFEYYFINFLYVFVHKQLV